uniref:BZIP domain-containing protein n=1 Tax=Globodera rostochiensis TaxID=31243 RepID=A0A914IDP8_GLORO
MNVTNWQLQKQQQQHQEENNNFPDCCCDEGQSAGPPPPPPEGTISRADENNYYFDNNWRPLLHDGQQILHTHLNNQQQRAVHCDGGGIAKYGDGQMMIGGMPKMKNRNIHVVYSSIGHTQIFTNSVRADTTLCAIPSTRTPPEALLYCACTPTSSEAPDLCGRQQEKALLPRASLSSSSLLLFTEKTCAWHRWIDQLLQEVRCEICAERLICIGRSTMSSSACGSSHCAFGTSSVNFEQLLKRKREQNRAAAQRYRHRKHCRLEWEQDEVARLMEQNEKMRAERERLRANIAKLKAQLSTLNGKDKNGKRKS